MTPSNQLVLPLNLEVMIPQNDSVRLLAKMMDELDYRKFYELQSSLGRPSSNPRILVRILLYASMNGIYSSRRIESACRRDIHFIWLLDGHKAPDHNTLSRFRSGPMGAAIEDLFYQMVAQLGTMGEIKYENLFVDGTKMEANAGRYTFVWRKTVEKNAAKLQCKMIAFVERIRENYGFGSKASEGNVDLCDLNGILNALHERKEQAGIPFVSGKGTRKTVLQRDIEELQEFRDSQAKYDRYNSLFAGRNSFSKTDPDATFMRMKEDHMLNGQLKPAYNIQIGVEGEYIVGVDLSCERSDQLTFIPFLDMLGEKLSKRHQNVVADAGYESEENYAYLSSSGSTPYIKPSTYERMKSRNFKKDIGKRENMAYDADRDVYLCHNQKQLKYLYSTRRKSKSGYASEIKVYECESCEGCVHKDPCTKAQGNKRLQVAWQFNAYREQSLANISSDLGKQLRMNRSIQVEGAFGVIKEDLGFRRFLHRGKQNVKTEFILLCFGFNLNKLHRKLAREMQGVSLFELKTG